MTFDIKETISILERTPKVLRNYLEGLPEAWLHNNEGQDTWSPFDVVGHLIHGEKTDWIPRIEIIFELHTSPIFKPFDRFAQFEASKNKTMSDLLSEFETLRNQNISKLKTFDLKTNHLNSRGIHPEFGEVTLEQLLSTWVVHDLGHIAQISRVMAKQYSENVGPWKAYLGVLNR